MSLRRLLLLIRYLPKDDHLCQLLEAEQHAEIERARTRRLAERRDYYRNRGGAT